MLKRIIAIVFGVVVVAVLNAIVSQPRSAEIADPKPTAALETSSSIDNTICERPKRQVTGGDVIESFDRLTHGDYAIRTRYK